MSTTSRAIAAAAALLTLAGCAHRTPPAAPTPGVTATPPAVPKSIRSLASFAKSNAAAPCFDRSRESYTAVVDTHFHPRPFGGQAIPPAELFGYLEAAGVRFVNYFGIGQSLDMKSDCTYYLDCPGTRRCRASRTTS